MCPNTGKKKIWLMRHGKIDFDYDNCSYEKFMELVSNGKDLPLAKDPQIDYSLLPTDVELICFSDTKRTKETANKVKKWLNNVSELNVMKQKLLNEVKLDRSVITREEYKGLNSLEERRPVILGRWYSKMNISETFDGSLSRVKEIEQFLLDRPETKILLITHGWFLRLLDLYFRQNKRDNISLKELLAVKPLEPGQAIHAELCFEPEEQLNPVPAVDAVSVHDYAAATT